MGKLTSLLKKKKSKGDDLSGNGTGSTMSGSSISVETSGIPATTAVFVPVAPLSLSIPTTEMSTTELQSPFSLMDDIMDELSGTTPDTPQPSKPADLSDFGITFELSRQLELGASEAKVSTARNGAPGSGNQKIGKLDQNSAFKDNAFLQQARSGTTTNPSASSGGAAPYRSTYSNSNSKTNNGGSATGNNNSSTTGSNATTAANTTTTSMTTTAATPSYLRGRLQTKEAEELAGEAAKLREASKKANAQLPSDDEGSDASDSDDSQYEPGFKKQQRLLQQQQYQHQLFLEQQQLLQQQLAGNGAGVKGPGAQEEEAKPVEINHEAVIDRMKDRHRALLQGAAAAAREEYYEDYRDEYGMSPQQMQSPPAVLNYNMQYGMDPSMMYADDYRIQQQQQQMYFAQGGMAANPHAHINATTYNHHSMNGMIPGYGYAHPPGPTPPYPSGMQTPIYQQQQQQMLQGGGGRGTPMSHVPAGILQGRSNSVVSDGSIPNSNSRRGSVQHSVVSSARVSEDSWNDTQQLQQQHSHHHGHQHQLSLSALSTQKSANSDSGYSGVASDQGKNTLDDSLEDIQTAVGYEYEKTRAKLDDVTKVIEVLSIAQAADKDSDGDDEDDESGSDSSDDDDDSDDDGKSQGSDLEHDEDPESLKGSTVIDSIRHGFKGITTGSSSATSNNGSNENDNDNDDEDNSSDDDQPIILSRRNSARGPFNLAKVSAEEAAMMPQVQGMMPPPQQQHQQQQQAPVPTNNAQMQYMAAAHTMGMYQQPIQGQMHMSYMPQQQPPQPVMSPPPQQQPHQQQQPYVPMGYQLPGPPQGIPSNMGHHHSYSVDRAPPNMMAGGPIVRRVTGSGAPSKGHTSTGSAGSAIQSQYPIPATTLLHPLPRRSQSVRVRPQATSPINNSNPTAGQGNGAAGAGRGRSSLDFVRLPSSGYQSLIGGPMSGPEFSSAAGVGVNGPYMRGYGGEPLSPPQQQPQQQSQQQPLPPHLQQHHQQMQQQMEKQQMQQGYYMGNVMGGPLMSPPLPSQYGYMMQSDPYSAHPHQQILQAGRR